jgi:hypothetical protein
VGFNIYIFSDQTRLYDIRLKTTRGNFSLKVELAKTMREKQKGLMFRENLKVGEGMLFVYKKPLIPTFWMKNTLIPLDMMFIGSDLSIKYIEQKVPPCTSSNDAECPRYSPPIAVRYILEVPGGYSKLFGIQPEDILEIITPIE